MSKHRFDKFIKERRILAAPVDLPMPGIVSPMRNCTVFLKRGGTLLGVLGAGEVNARGYVSTGSTVFISAKRLEKAIYNGKANVTMVNNQICQKTSSLDILSEPGDLGSIRSIPNASRDCIDAYKSTLYSSLIYARNETISFLDIGWFNSGLPVFSVHSVCYPISGAHIFDRRARLMGTMLVSVKDREALGNIYIDMIQKHSGMLPKEHKEAENTFIGWGYPSDDNISMQKNYTDVPFFAYNKYRLSMFPRLETDIDKLLEELNGGTLRQPFLISIEPEHIFTAEKYSRVITCGDNQDTNYIKAVREMMVEYPVDCYLPATELFNIQIKINRFNQGVVEYVKNNRRKIT